VEAPIGLWSDDGQSGAYSSSVGLVPPNALALRDLTNFRMVGKREVMSGSLGEEIAENGLGRRTENLVSGNDRAVAVGVARGSVDAAATSGRRSTNGVKLSLSGLRCIVYKATVARKREVVG